MSTACSVIRKAAREAFPPFGSMMPYQTDGPAKMGIHGLPPMPMIADDFDGVDVVSRPCTTAIRRETSSDFRERRTVHSW